MKVFQTNWGFMFRDVTREYESAAEARTHFAPNINFVDAPDYVFESWGYDDTAEGDARFVRPTAPEGWLYDGATGTFYRDGDEKPESTRLTDLYQQSIDIEYEIALAEEAALNA